MTNRSTQIFVLILFFIAVLMGYNYFAKPFLSVDTVVEEVKEEVNAELAENYIDERLKILNELTTEQKISQLIAYSLVINSELDDSNEAKDSKTVGLSSTSSAELTKLDPGIITLFGSNVSFDNASSHLKQIKELFNNKALQPLIAVDHEGGSVQRLSGEGFTQLPSLKEMCDADKYDLQQQLFSSAKELSDLGVNIIFAPVLDIDSKVLGDRSCSDYDSLLITSIEFIKVFGDQQILPVIKHFPGLGQTSKDLHKFPDSIQLNENDTLIFSKVLDIYPNIGVMSSHVQIKDMLEGKPCSMSEECLSVFNNKMPLVILFTDALEMGALNSSANDFVKNFSFLELDVSDGNTLSKTSLLQEEKLSVLSYQAIMAGNNVLVFGSGVEANQLTKVVKELSAHYEQDEEFAKKVNESLIKILAVKKIHHDQ